MKRQETGSDYLISRREMLGKSFGGVLLAARWPLGLRQAIAQRRITGKPLLTAASISEMFAANRKLLSEFQADPKGFMLGHFSLTPGQEAAVRATTPEEIAAIRTGVETALRENLEVSASCATSGVAATQKLVAQARRFQYISDSSHHPGRGSAGILHMNVTGFDR